MQFTQDNNALLAGDDPVLDPRSTDNHIEMKREAEENKLHWMAKVHNFLEMWQGSQNLRASQKESRTQNNSMTAVGYISDNEGIVKALWSNFQHDGAAALKLSEQSTVPPALFARNLTGGQAEVLTVRWVKRIDRHPAKSDEDSSPENISGTANWLHWNGNLDNPNDSEDDWAADNESEMELDSGSEHSEIPEQQHLSATLNVSGLIWPIQWSKKKVEKTLMTVNIMETRRNKGIKKK